MRKGNKISLLVKVNDIIVGTSGTMAEGSLMQYYMRTHNPATAALPDILDFLVEFSRWKKDLMGDSSVNNHYIVAYDGHLFYADGVCPYGVRDFCSIGAGRNYANAVMKLGHTPKEAVKVACDLCCYVAEPVIEEVMLR